MSETGGYPSPEINGYTLEDGGGDDPVTRRNPAGKNSTPADSKLVKITIHGENFLERAMFPIIRIGDLRVKKCRIASDGKSITCYFERMPEEGAEVFVGYGLGQSAICDRKFTCK